MRIFYFRIVFVCRTCENWFYWKFMVWIVPFAKFFHFLCTRFGSLPPLFENTLRSWLLQVSFSYYLYMMYIYLDIASQVYIICFAHQLHGILSSHKDMGFWYLTLVCRSDGKNCVRFLSFLFVWLYGYVSRRLLEFLNCRICLFCCIYDLDRTIWYIALLNDYWPL